MIVKRIDLLRKIYDRNEDNGFFIVKVSINRYTDIFNDLDPAPLRKRDLDAEFINYLEDCSSDIPLKFGMELQIHCPSLIRDPLKEERARAGISTYCNLVMLTLKGKLVSSYKTSLVYALVFTVLMALAFTLIPHLPTNVITETLREGIFIGGWVFLWEAIALLFIQNKSTRLAYRRHERLEGAAVTFVYS